MEPLVTGINILNQNNQFKPTDLSSEFNDSEKITDNQNKVNRLYPTIKKFSYLPTHEPSNFNEQFAIYNSKLYCYINGTWTALN